MAAFREQEGVAVGVEEGEGAGEGAEAGAGPRETEGGSSQFGLSWGVWGTTRGSAWETHTVKNLACLSARLWS